MDALLKGYGQVLICLNPITGLFLAVAVFLLSPRVGLLTLAGVLASTAGAYWLGAKRTHIQAGVYGFNGVVLGIAWLWFFRMNVWTVLLLLLGAGVTSLLMKVLSERSARTSAHLPVLSVPSVIVIWFLVGVLGSLFTHWELTGPDRYIREYQEVYEVIASSPSRTLALQALLRVCAKYVLAILLLLVGVLAHSRISALIALLSFVLALLGIYCLGGMAEFKNLEFYLYNAVPCGIALAGTFLVANRRVIYFALGAVALTVALTYLGLRYFPLPAFVAPFNTVAILFVWLAKSHWLGKGRGFYAIPMDLVSTPELGMAWYEGEMYAKKYWDDIKGQSA